jgi:hypothetical protein
MSIMVSSLLSVMRAGFVNMILAPYRTYPAIKCESSRRLASKLSLVSPDRNVQPIGNCNCLSLVATFRNALICSRVEHEINLDSQYRWA